MWRRDGVLEVVLEVDEVEEKRVLVEEEDDFEDLWVHRSGRARGDGHRQGNLFLWTSSQDLRSKRCLSREYIPRRSLPLKL